MKQSIVVTGGAGLLGLNWALAARERYAVTLGLHRREVALAGVDTRIIDLANPQPVLEQLRPVFVVHTAGMTNVEQCEHAPELARHVNVDLAVSVARACGRLQIPMVHISTDHLFSGDRPYAVETDPVSPTNVYGRTKADAEAGVVAACASALVVRTNFFGCGPSYRRSFSDVIVAQLRARRTVSLFHDVFFTPVWMNELVDEVHDLVNQGVRGIVHVAANERLSKYDFGQRVARAYGLDANLIVPGRLADRTDLVRRPFDMSLSNKKVSQLLGRRVSGIDEQLRELRRQDELLRYREVQQL